MIFVQAEQYLEIAAAFDTSSRSSLQQDPRQAQASALRAREAVISRRVEAISSGEIQVQKSTRLFDADVAEFERVLDSVPLDPAIYGGVLPAELSGLISEVEEAPLFPPATSPSRSRSPTARPARSQPPRPPPAPVRPSSPSVGNRESRASVVPEVRRQPPPPPPVPRNSGPRPSAAPETVVSSPEECVSPSQSSQGSSASGVDYQQLFDERPRGSSAAASSARPVVPEPPCPKARPVAPPPVESGVRVFHAESVDADRLWSGVLHRFSPGQGPVAVLSLDFHQVADKCFWTFVEVLNEVQSKNLAIIVTSYTQSRNLEEAARAFLVRALNSSRFRGPLCLAITSQKTGRRGKHALLAWWLRAAPDQVRGIVHVDDSAQITREFDQRNTRGLSARLFPIDSDYNLFESLKWWDLL